MHVFNQLLYRIFFIISPYWRHGLANGKYNVLQNSDDHVAVSSLSGVEPV